jgi:hypothetical protein
MVVGVKVTDEYRSVMDRLPDLPPGAIEDFRRAVYDHYREEGRDLPWRDQRSLSNGKLPDRDQIG